MVHLLLLKLIYQDYSQILGKSEVFFLFCEQNSASSHQNQTADPDKFRASLRIKSF